MFDAFAKKLRVLKGFPAPLSVLLLAAACGSDGISFGEHLDGDTGSAGTSAQKPDEPSPSPEPPGESGGDSNEGAEPSDGSGGTSGGEPEGDPELGGAPTVDEPPAAEGGSRGELPPGEPPVDEPNSAGAGGTSAGDVAGDAGAPSEGPSDAGAGGAPLGGAANGGGPAGGSAGSSAGGMSSVGGAPAAGSGGVSSAGSGGNGGTSVAVGGASAGSGPAPEPEPPAGEACTACGSDSCSAEITRCEASPTCARWLSCVAGCDDTACTNTCDRRFKQAVLLTTPVYQCLCNRCADECSPLPVCDKTCEPGAGPPAATATLPATLAETGLYTRRAGEAWQVASYVQRYQPEYELFSDFSVKERFIYLPRCAQIDTRDMDHWSFPVGTRIWKQFTRDGVRIETRVMSRYGRGAGDWAMAAYQWPLPAAGSSAPDPALATLAPEDGASDVNGTEADIPSAENCRFCHERLSERVLGFGAIQLSHNLAGVSFTDLVDWGVLSRAPARTGYDPPGDATARAALGYLHANCGGCHNDTGVRTSLYLRLLVGQRSVESTWAFTTAVDVGTNNPNFPMDRIEPGDPDRSAIIVRMQRDPSAGEIRQMPPLGREIPHPDGIAAVSAWIAALNPSQ